MEAPVITRRRRPFLMPIWLLALIVLVPVAFAFLVYRNATTTTVVVVRHAEKVLGTISDPPLDAQGELRAQQLARMFGGVEEGRGRVDAVYVTDTRRAQQTAAPLLARLHAEPIVVDGTDMHALALRIQQDNRGKVALVVGHSNTVPQLIQQLSGTDVGSIAEDEYDNMYIVSVPTLGSANVVRMKY